MTGEVTIVKNSAIKTTIPMHMLPLAVPDYLDAQDQMGRFHELPLGSVDMQTLEKMLADHRERFLRAAGYGHVLTMLR